MAKKPISKNPQKSVVEEVKEDIAEEPVVEKSDDDFTVFVSTEPENGTWNMQISGKIYRGFWDGKGTRVNWRIDNAVADRVKDHMHFKNGRIVKA